MAFSASAATCLGASALFVLSAWLRSLGLGKLGRLGWLGFALLLLLPALNFGQKWSGMGALAALILALAGGWLSLVGWRVWRASAEPRDPPLAARSASLESPWRPKRVVRLSRCH